MSNANNGGAEISGAAKAGWFILGFCVPLAGLILWLVWMRDEPQKSRYCRNGFIASLVSALAVTCLLVCLSFVFMTQMLPEAGFEAAAYAAAWLA